MRKKKPQQQERDHLALEWCASRTVKRQDELRCGGEVLATLRWESMWSTLSTGTARMGRWTFERPGLLSRDIEVRIPGAGDDAPWAVFSPGWTSEGTLCLADGRRFHWQCTDFWQTEWVFVSAAGSRTRPDFSTRLPRWGSSVPGFPSPTARCWFSWDTI